MMSMPSHHAPLADANCHVFRYEPKYVTVYIIQHR